VAYRAHGSVNSVSILILKHRHGLVTDCSDCPTIGRIVSVADLSVKLLMGIEIEYPPDTLVRGILLFRDTGCLSILIEQQRRAHLNVYDEKHKGRPYDCKG